MSSDPMRPARTREVSRPTNVPGAWHGVAVPALLLALSACGEDLIRGPTPRRPECWR